MKKIIGTSIEPELLDKIDNISKEKLWTRSSTIRYIIREYFKND